MSKVFPLSFRHHTKKLSCLFTASLNSMHGRKARPTTNPGKSNTTKVCYKPLCGSIKLQVSSRFIAGQSHGIIVGHLIDNLTFLMVFFTWLWCIPGLGTSTSQEAKGYFSDMQRHRIPFKYAGPEDDEAITLVWTFYFLLYLYNLNHFLRSIYSMKSRHYNGDAGISFFSIFHISLWPGL